MSRSSGLLRIDVAKAAVKQTDSHVDQGTAKLCFDLPNGKKEVLQFRMDQTVGHAKVQLETLHSIPFSALELSLDGKTLADPLSFNDFPQIRAALSSKNTVHITVKVSSGAENEERNHREEEHKGEEEEKENEDFDDEELDDDEQQQQQGKKTTVM